MATPPILEPIAPRSGELPIYSSDDVQKLLPAPYKNSPKKPVLDAHLEALTEIALAWEDAATDAAAESDTATADDQYLDGQGEDHTVHRAADESNDDYRARMVATPKLVTVAAILEAVNSILAPLTTVQAELFDSILDRLFITDGTLRWHSFIGANPQYFARLYPDDHVANGERVRPQSRPGGAWVGGDHVGRMLVLRVPNLGGLANHHAFVFSSSAVDAATSIAIDPKKRMFVGNGSQSTAASFVADTSITAQGVYQAIVDKINGVLGQSIRWKLVVDPHLQ